MSSLGILRLLAQRRVAHGHGHGSYGRYLSLSKHPKYTTSTTTSSVSYGLRSFSSKTEEDKKMTAEPTRNATPIPPDRYTQPTADTSSFMAGFGNSLQNFSLFNFQFPLREPEEGSGFDNFLKRNKLGGSDASNTNNNKKKGESEGESDGKKDKDQDKNYKSSGGGGNDNKNNNNNNDDGDNGNLVIITTMMLVVAAIMSSSSGRDQSSRDNNSNNSSNQHSYSTNSTADSPSASTSGGMSAAAGRVFGNNNSNNKHIANHLDLTWGEFLKLLEHDAVFKIVIHQGQAGNDDHHASTRARVYMKPGVNLDSVLLSGTTADVMPDDNEWSTGGDTNNTTTSNNNPEWSSTNGLTTTTASNNHNNTPLIYRNLRIGSAQSLERKLEEAQRALGRSPQQDIPVQYQVDSSVATELLGLLPWILLSGFLVASFRGAAGRMGGVGATGSSGSGGMFGMGKSTAQKFTKEMNINIGFADVAGCDEAKREIKEFVEFLQTPDRFTQLGAKIPKGALLAGPPGTGKTLLAKAVAGESGVPFYSLAGSEFLEMFVGVGPSRVRDLFREARENAPCIIFIDEIDSIGRKRGKSSAMGGNDERENTLNQLLVEMDGFDPSAGVVCLAGTNRDDILDPALTRPGRFDRKIQVDLPDIQGRKEIFQVHLKKITLVEGMGPVISPDAKSDDNSDNDKEEPEMTPEQRQAIDNVASRLAGLTPGFSGADIANICNEAAIVAARRNADSVIMDDFEKATDRVIGGLESNRIMSKEERSIVAYHEAGHAVAGWFLEHADPLLKVTIIPRASGALGFAQYLPKEVNLRTQDQIMDIVAMALAGRAAEEVFFGSVTTGASDDLRRVTQMVYSTIQLYGMNDRLGQLAFPKDPTAMWEERRYSEKTAKAMDEEAKHIVDQAYERTLALMRERKDEVDKVAKLLLEKETVNHDEIYDLIGARPFGGDKNYEEYVSRRQAERKQKAGDAAEGEATDDANAPNLNPSF
ncbi:metalloprotease FTSH [Seminavis robusta]|uniref:Metalloprotease FTSH n=1 Tax=Seminavis robusta TaxID=568900 RepID=A0A9N8HDZ9_9STRA|nr:metalloprotease FTSH [Seminavis robusta]|eukprot:Sro279_g106870.1 metalloprotease FTSH (985) ;mRNA; f:55804-59074